MRKCKNKLSGEVCEYFVYYGMVTHIPSWYTGGHTSLVYNNHVVRNKYGFNHILDDYGKFSEQYEIIDPITGSDGEVYSPPATEDILEKGREHVEAFNNRMEELKYTGICQDKETNSYYCYKMYGSSFCVYRKQECYFTKEFFNKIFYVVMEPDIVSPPKSNVDASFVGDTLDHVGRKCRAKYGHGDKTFDLFIYGQDKSPKWFDYGSLNEKQKDILIRKGIGYVVNELYGNDKVFIFTHKTFMEYMEEIEFNAHAEYGSINREIVDTGKHTMDKMINSLTSDISERPEKMVINDGVSEDLIECDGYSIKKPVDIGAYLSAEDIAAAGTKVHTDNWQKGLDEYVEKEEAKSSVNEGRICWRKIDTFIFNFFVYGVDNYPSWYDDENTFHQYLKEGDWVVRDFSHNRYDFYFYSCPNMVADVFEQIENPEFYDNSVIVDRDQYNEIKEQMDLIKMLPDANQWFNNMHPEVFRYLVIRDMNRNDGKVYMLKLYKNEISKF